MPTTTTNNAWPIPLDADPFKDGALAMRNLGNGIDTSVGTGLLAWTAYTPTISGVTIGNATTTFVYAKLGKNVIVRGVCTFGSTSTVTGPLDVSLPVNNTGYSTTGIVVGNTTFYNGTSYFYGPVVSIGQTDKFRCVAYNVSGTYATGSDVSTTAPFTWAPATNKFFACQFIYQAA